MIPRILPVQPEIQEGLNSGVVQPLDRGNRDRIPSREFRPETRRADPHVAEKRKKEFRRREAVRIQSKPFHRSGFRTDSAEEESVVDGLSVRGHMEQKGLGAPAADGKGVRLFPHVPLREEQGSPESDVPPVG